MAHDQFCSGDKWCDCDILYLARLDQATTMLQAIDNMIRADAAVLDRGEFPDGTGQRDPYEKGVTQGMKMARKVAAETLVPLPETRESITVS